MAIITEPIHLAAGRSLIFPKPVSGGGGEFDQKAKQHTDLELVSL